MKRLFTFLTVFALIFAFSVSVFAVNNESENTSDIAPCNESVADTAPDGEAINTADGVSDTENETSPNESADDSENVFELFYRTITESSGEILAAISLILTTLLTLAYRRGLVPIMKGGLSAIGGAIGEVKESSRREADLLSERSEQMLKAAKLSEENTAHLDERLTALASALSDVKDILASEKEIKLILSCQIDALSEVFNTSSLPEYRKEAFCKRIAEMKEALNDGFVKE